MTTKPTALPDGATAVIPHLVCADAAAAIDFYAQAFDAVEEMRMPGPDGKLVHALIRINGAPIMLMDEFPEWGALGAKSIGKTAVTIHLYVSDVDAAFQQAIDAGATVEMEVSDQFWGDRYGSVIDPFGHSWSLATPGANPPQTPEELQQAMADAGMAG